MGGERDTNFTRDEQRTMMTLWCIFGSPLMIGAELTKLDGWTLSLLTNIEVLKLVSNDYVGRQEERSEEYAIWSCLNRKTGEKYLAYFNLCEEDREIAYNINEVEQFAEAAGEGVIVVDAVTDARELWSGETEVVNGCMLKTSVPAHGVKLFLLS